jgi:peptide/nickel transport system permease protein
VKSVGVKDWRVLMQHVLPNSIAPSLVLATMMVASAILAEAAVSFLGAGVPPPTPTWGGMLSDGRQYMSSGEWWMTVFPGAAIFVTVMAFNFVGDGLRDALDPKLRRRMKV